MSFIVKELDKIVEETNYAIEKSSDEVMKLLNSLVEEMKQFHDKLAVGVLGMEKQRDD